MSLGIYKPHQGYWVRVMTAIFAGVLVLACAAWAWQQAALFTPPTPTWKISTALNTGEPVVGSRVTLIQSDGINTPVQLGSADVLSFTAESQGRASIVIGALDFSDDYRPSMATGILDASGYEGQVHGYQGIPIFDRIYVQAGAVGAVLLFGAVLIYYVVGLKKSTSEFLIATDGEMKKVNWSTRKEIIGSTWVVVTATFLLTAVLFTIDFVFSRFFTLIHVLEQ